MKNSVESTINQTYKDIEVILVDDGSVDGCAEMCDTYEKEYEFIKVVHKKNGGLSSARNAGIDVAKGELLMFLDGDDYLAINAVERLVNIINETHADIVQYGYVETECNFKIEYVNAEIEYTLISDRKGFFDKLYEIGGEAASACTKLYKKELFNELRFQEGILHEDEYLITRMLNNVSLIAYTNFKPYFYVLRNNSIINSEFNIGRLDVFYVKTDRLKMLQTLGYQDLMKIEYENYFAALMNYYCAAKKAQNTDACNHILNLIRKYKEFKYIPSGKFKIFCFLCRVNPRFVEVYYILKKFFGHIT